MQEEGERIDTQHETRIDKMVWEGFISLGTINRHFPNSKIVKKYRGRGYQKA